MAVKIDGQPWTWMGSKKPYGGYITNVSINVGLAGSVTSASLTIVSEDGNYEVSNLGLDRCGGGPKVLDIPFLKMGFLMYAVGAAISDGGGGNILTLELVDASIDWLHKCLAINKRFKPKRGGLVDGVAWIGEEYYNDSSSTKGEMIKRDDMLQKNILELDIGETAEGQEASFKNPFLAEQARTEFGTWYWTPKEFVNETYKLGVPWSDAAYSTLQSYDDLFFTDSGSVQVLMNSIGNVIGASFYFDPFDKNIKIMGAGGIPASFSQRDGDKLVSFRYDQGYRETSLQSQVCNVSLAGGDPGNPKFSILMPSKALSPIFGKMVVGYPLGEAAEEGEATPNQPEYEDPLFEESNIITKEGPSLTVKNLMALNLLKACALGEDFAKLYILIKKAGAKLDKYGSNACDYDWKCNGWRDVAWKLGEVGFPEITNYDLVDDLFPSEIERHTCNGLHVIPAGSPDRKSFDGKDPTVPNCPQNLAKFMEAFLLRNPLTAGRIEPKSAPDNIDGYTKDLMVVWVEEFKSHPKAAHPILGTSNWTNPAFEKLMAWGEMARKYFTARGEFEAPCDKGDKEFTYSHNNWLPAMPSAPVPSIAPVETPDEYLNAAESPPLLALGKAYNTKFNQVGEGKVTAADLVETLGIGGAPAADKKFNTQYSCMEPVEAGDIAAGATVDENNCEINQSNTLYLFDVGINTITEKDRQTAGDWVDRYFYISKRETATAQQTDGTTNRFDAIILPSLKGEFDVTEKYSYYPKDPSEAKEGEKVEIKEGTKKFEKVDEIDKFLSTINIGVDINGYVHPAPINLIKTPDRYEYNTARVAGICYGGSYYYNHLNPTTWDSNQLEALSLIPPADVGGPGEDGRGTYDGMSYVGDCDKEGMKDTYYTGITPDTIARIQKNAKVKVGNLFSLAQDQGPTMTATFQVMGEATIPSVAAGLSNLSIQGGQTPMVTYTIGNRKVRLAQEGNKRDIIGPEAAKQKIEDPFMQKFSSKFQDKLAQPLPARKLFNEAVAKNPNLKGNLNKGKLS